MARKSEREIERALDDVSTPPSDGVLAWLRDWTVDSLKNGAGVGVDLGGDGGPYGEGITVFIDEDRGAEWRLPAEEFPAWVDVDEDLPIRGGADANPFIVADFTRTQT